jgi:SAM-dependent methyltransferase
MFNLRSIGSNLIESNEGILTTPAHRDLEFAYTDDTNWLAVEGTSFWYRHRNRCFLAILQRFQPTGPVFEIGSGNGSVAMTLQSAGLEVVAVEPTVKSALASRKRGVNCVICAKIEEAGFDDGALANIGLFDVLEHIEDDIGFVRQLRKLMPLGGYFYCAVPAWNMLWSSEDAAAGHRRRYSLRRLSNIFETAGFKIEYRTYFFAPLLLPIVLLRTIPTALRLRTFRTAELSNKEHTLPKGVIGSFLNTALEREVQCLSRGGVKHIGASCLLVARAC